MSKNFKKYTIFLVTFFSLILGTSSLFAQGNNSVEIDLEPITIPVFNIGTDIIVNLRNGSILSWLSFFGGLLTIVLLIYWVFRILVSSINAIRSEGDKEKLENAIKSIRSNFIGAVVTLAFPIILSLIGVVLGVGTVFDWPKSFRFCPEESEYTFYFEAFLKEGTQELAEQKCGSV